MATTTTTATNMYYDFTTGQWYMGTNTPSREEMRAVAHAAMAALHKANKKATLELRSLDMPKWDEVDAMRWIDLRAMLEHITASLEEQKKLPEGTSKMLCAVLDLSVT